MRQDTPLLETVWEPSGSVYRLRLINRGSSRLSGYRLGLSGPARLSGSATLSGGVVVGGYLVYYTRHVSEPFTGTTATLVGRLADSMIGTAFGSALVGGPWRWEATAPPNAFADPPAWTVHLAWVVVAIVVLLDILRKRGARR